jgi:hypothetical protein
LKYAQPSVLILNQHADGKRIPSERFGGQLLERTNAAQVSPTDAPLHPKRTQCQSGENHKQVKIADHSTNRAQTADRDRLKPWSSKPDVHPFW